MSAPPMTVLQVSTEEEAAIRAAVRGAGGAEMVIAGRHIYGVDAGEGGARNLTLMGLPTGRIEQLFLTHFHSDHIDGLGPMLLLRWAGVLVCRTWVRTVVDGTGRALLLAGAGAAEGLATDLAADVAAMAGRAAISALLP